MFVSLPGWQGRDILMWLEVQVGIWHGGGSFFLHFVNCLNKWLVCVSWHLCSHLIVKDASVVGEVLFYNSEKQDSKSVFLLDILFFCPLFSRSIFFTQCGLLLHTFINKGPSGVSWVRFYFGNQSAKVQWDLLSYQLSVDVATLATTAQSKYLV